jgi:hypothetical protein
MATPRTSMTVASVVSISIVSTARRSIAANPRRQRPHGRDVDLAVEREGRGAAVLGDGPPGKGSSFWTGRRAEVHADPARSPPRPGQRRQVDAFLLR